MRRVYTNGPRQTSDLHTFLAAILNTPPNACHEKGRGGGGDLKKKLTLDQAVILVYTTESSCDPSLRKWFLKLNRDRLNFSANRGLQNVAERGKLS